MAPKVKLRETVQYHYIERKSRARPAFVVEGIGGEIFDTLFWVRGPEQTFLDFAADPTTACSMMDKLVDFQMRYWETVLETFGGYALVIRLGDDLGDQRGTRISPAMYRRYIKPRHAKLCHLSYDQARTQGGAASLWLNLLDSIIV